MLLALLATLLLCIHNYFFYFQEYVGQSSVKNDIWTFFKLKIDNLQKLKHIIGYPIVINSFLFLGPLYENILSSFIYREIAFFEDDEVLWVKLKRVLAAPFSEEVIFRVLYFNINAHDGFPLDFVTVVPLFFSLCKVNYYFLKKFLFLYVIFDDI